MVELRLRLEMFKVHTEGTSATFGRVCWSLEVASHGSEPPDSNKLPGAQILPPTAVGGSIRAPGMAPPWRPKISAAGGVGEKAGQAGLTHVKMVRDGMCEEGACTGPAPSIMIEGGPQTLGVYRENAQARSARAQGRAGREVSKGGVGEDSVRNELAGGCAESSRACTADARRYVSCQQL